MDTPTFELTGVSKAYDGAPVLRDIPLAIRESAAALALVAQGVFELAERRFVPLGLRLRPGSEG